MRQGRLGGKTTGPMTTTYHHALAAGTRLESYEISHVLGVGGFGVTYRAFDHTLQCDVAIKEYLPTGLAVRTPDGSTVTPKSENDAKNYHYGLQRFLDEARTLAKFREPHIVRVLRYLEAHGTAYFVMDYEEGESLAALLKKTRTLDEGRIRSILLPILGSLRSVHAQKFLHRDIKPANIYVRTDGSPVLLDFGAARLALGEQSRAMTGMVTPGYAPFEQYFTRGKQGPWTDIYGIGATIYQCITGLVPVAATDRVAALQDDEPDPIGDLKRLAGKRYSATFLQAVSWMLAPNAKDRPQSVDALLEALTDAKTAAPAAGRSEDELRGPRFPETENIDEMVDTGASWEPEVLKTVEVNLAQHIGPLSRVLVKKAARKSANIEELTELLARFIPEERERTVFLAHTQRLHPTDVPSPAAAAVSPPAPADVKTSFDADTLRSVERALALYVGPMAKILVNKAAPRASDLERLCELLTVELNDPAQRHAFRRAVLGPPPSRRR